MKRKLFALLFLLSGLAMFAAPAQAANLAKPRAQVESTTVANPAARVSDAAQAVARLASPRVPPTRLAVRLLIASATPAPTVVLGADRALE